MFAELQAFPTELQGHVELPMLRWKYTQMKPLFGLKAVRWVHRVMPETKSWFERHWDKAMFSLESRPAAHRRLRAMSISQAN
jgi:hypothetical protein